MFYLLFSDGLINSPARANHLGVRKTGLRTRFTYWKLWYSHTAGGLVYKDTTFVRLSEVRRMFFGM